MKKTVAVLGAAEGMGSALAHSLASAGYRVLLAEGLDHDVAQSPESLPQMLLKIRATVPQADIEVASSPTEACWEADIILPAVSYAAQAEMAHMIKDVVTGKIIISLLNPSTLSYNGHGTTSPASAAEELACLLPNSSVVKAFNTVFPADLGSPKVDGKVVDVFLAGDDEEALSTVAQLVKDVGFNPLYAGDLSVSRTLENMMALLTELSARNDFRGPVGWKVLHERLRQNGSENFRLRSFTRF